VSLLGLVASRWLQNAQFRAHADPRLGGDSACRGENEDLNHIHANAAKAMHARNATNANSVITASRRESSGSFLGVTTVSRKIVGPHLLLMRPHYWLVP
jgi:hypothetical protein